jgi:polyisoprenoid-binding protein YceI
MKLRPGFFIVLGLLLAVAAGVWLYDWALGPTEEASEPIRADPVLSDDAEDIGSPELASGARTTFEIVSESSEVRFIIFEELRGEPVDVVGISNQVAGQFLVDFASPANSRLGTIRINARTFVTDEERRDRATRNRILYTDDFEYITFVPEEISGLNGAIMEGEPVEFTVSGNLTIRDVSRPAVFEASLTLASPDILLGAARTTVSRRDFDLVIPNLPFIANVADEVRLEFEGELRPLSATTPSNLDAGHEPSSTE